MDDTSRRKPYHHGNLREALVAAALALIEEKGPLGFTLAEAARGAGVSPAAPYRHFRGRDDLLAEVARQGFMIFAERLEEAYAAAGSSSLGALSAVGEAYLAFARTNPGHYQAMFESGLEIACDPALTQIAGRAFAVLTQVAARLVAGLPPDRRPPPSMVANYVWAFSHGVVELFGRGRPGSRAPYSAEEMLESGVTVYLRGLGLIPH